MGLFNTYESTVQTLRTIKTVVGRGNITVERLRASFPSLCDVGSNDLQEFIDAFKPAPLTGKNAKGWKMPTPEMTARRFLANTCGRTAGTIQKIVSQVRTSKRNPRKRKKPAKYPGVSLGKLD